MSSDNPADNQTETAPPTPVVSARCRCSRRQVGTATWNRGKLVACLDCEKVLSCIGKDPAQEMLKRMIRDAKFDLECRRYKALRKKVGFNTFKKERS